MIKSGPQGKHLLFLPGNKQSMDTICVNMKILIEFCNAIKINEHGY